MGRIAQSLPSHAQLLVLNCPRSSSQARPPRSPPPHAPLYSDMNDPMSRRRSVDVGGLALALGDEGRGHGWGGWEETDCGETRCVTS